MQRGLQHWLLLGLQRTQDRLGVVPVLAYSTICHFCFFFVGVDMGALDEYLWSKFTDFYNIKIPKIFEKTY